MTALLGRGGTSNENGDIVFAPNATGGLFLVSSNGGTPREIVKPDSANSEESYRFPFFLPDGVHFLYTVEAKFSGSSNGDVVMIGSINSDIKDTVMQVSSNAQYEDGYLFFVRQSTLMCQAFDPDNFKLTGDIYTITENVQYNNNYIYSSYSISDAGNLIFQSKNENNLKNILVDDKGNSRKELFTKNIFNTAKFSSDGTKILFDSYNNDNKTPVIWIYNIKQNILSRMTFDSNLNQYPIWSPDGKEIAFTSNLGMNLGIYIKNLYVNKKDSVIYQSPDGLFLSTSDWSGDGKYILIIQTQQNSSAKGDIIIYDFKDKTSRYIANTDFNEEKASFSDNMKWIIYDNDESGKSQVYVQNFGSNGLRYPLTSNGGLPLRFVENDHAIIYQWQNLIYKMKVQESDGNLIADSPEVLFNTTEKNILTVYDVTKDGKTFLCSKQSGTTIFPPLTYIQNWKGLISEDKK